MYILHHRKITLIVWLMLAGWVSLFAAPVSAATINVTTAGEFVQAIIDAEDEVAYPGADVIDLGGHTITIGQETLPELSSELTIQNGTLEIDAAANPSFIFSINRYAIVQFHQMTFRVSNESLTLIRSVSEDLTITESTFQHVQPTSYYISLHFSSSIAVTYGTLISDSVFRGTTIRAGSTRIQGSVITDYHRGYNRPDAAVIALRDLIIENTQIKGNHHSAAIENYGRVIVLNSQLSGNSIGISNASRAYIIIVRNSVIANNSDYGIRHYGNAEQVEVVNSILWLNEDDVLGDITMTDSIISQGYAGAGNSSRDPRFVDPLPEGVYHSTGGDYRLQFASPAIDAGNNNAAQSEGVPATDLAANPRYVDDTGVLDRGTGSTPIIDIGAYEYQGPSCTDYTFPYVVGSAADLIGAVACANASATVDEIDLNGQVFTFYTATASIASMRTALPEIIAPVVIRNGTLERGPVSSDFRLFAVAESGDLTLDTVTLRNGGLNAPIYETPSGGAIYNDGVLTLRHAVITRNQIQLGKGAVHNNGSLTVEDSHFIDNQIWIHGGTGLLNEGNATVTRSTFQKGGVINEAGATLLIQNSVMTGTPSSAIYNRGHATAINLQVTGNNYGFVSNEGSHTTVLNSTIAANSEYGVWVRDDSSATTFEIVNSILWGHYSYGFGTPLDISGPADVTYSIVESGHPGEGNRIVNPRFVNQLSSSISTGGDYRLLEASPAIDAGHTGAAQSAGLTHDLSGNPRYVDDTGYVDTGIGSAPVVDIGAYEHQGTSCTSYSFPYTVQAQPDDLSNAIACANGNATADVIDLNGDTIPVSPYSAYERNKPLYDKTSLPFITDHLTLQNGTLNPANNTERLIYILPQVSLTLDTVDVLPINTGSSVSEGGIIYNDRGSLTVMNSTLSGGRGATYGGAIYNNMGNIILRDSMLEGYTAYEEGGVIYSEGGTVLLESSVLNNNVTQGGDLRNPPAGGTVIYQSGGELVVRRSIFKGNTGNHASGVIHVTGGAQTTITGSLFAGNTAEQSSAIYSDGSQTLLSNNTFSGNAGATTVRVDGPVTLTNNIIYGNLNVPHSDSFPVTLSVPDDATVHYNLIEGGYAGVGNMALNPYFVNPVSARDAPTATGDYRLSDYSPAIDAGSNPAAGNSGLSNDDLDGLARYMDDSTVPDTGEGSTPFIDIGAYEFQSDSDCAGYGFPYVVTAGADDLIQAIHCASVTPGDDVIDLGGATIAIPTAFRNERDSSGLPALYHGITLKNGTIDLTGLRTTLLRVLPAGQLTLDAITMQNGSWIGRGMIENQSELTVLNSTFRNNAISVLLNSSGQLTLVNSDFSNNTFSGNSNHLVRVTAGPLLVQDSSFVNNTGQGSVAIYHEGAELEITGTTFEGNSSSSRGVALYVGSSGNLSDTVNLRANRFINNSMTFSGRLLFVYDRQVVLENTVFAGNTFTHSGRLLSNVGSDMLMRNVLITGNHAIDEARMIYNSASPVADARIELVNVTIAGNGHAAGAGVISNISSADYLAEITMSNSIVYGNDGPVFSNEGAMTRVSVAYTIIEGGYSGTANLDVDPKFFAPEPASAAPTIAGDYRLYVDSPAVDSGSNTVAAAIQAAGLPDVAGETRYLDVPFVTDSGEGTAPIIDRGAYEFPFNLEDMDVNQDDIISPTDVMYVLNRLGSTDMSADVDDNSVIEMIDVFMIQEMLGE